MSYLGKRQYVFRRFRRMMYDVRTLLLLACDCKCYSRCISHNEGEKMGGGGSTTKR